LTDPIPCGTCIHYVRSYQDFKHHRTLYNICLTSSIRIAIEAGKCWAYKPDGKQEQIQDPGC